MLDLPNIVLVIADVVIASTSVMLAYFARFEGSVPSMFLENAPWVVVYFAVAVPLAFRISGLYDYLWRQVGIDMMLKLGKVVAALSLVGIVLVLVWSAVAGYRTVPVSLPGVTGLLVFLGSGSIRTVARINMYSTGRASDDSGRRVLIVGAGDAGSLLMRDIESRSDSGMLVVGFLDDDPGKHGRIVGRVRVEGASDEIGPIAERLDATEVIVAIPSASRESLARILNLSAQQDLRVRVMPGIAQSASTTTLDDLRPVEVEDLLGREPADVNLRLVQSSLQDKTVVVTGAAGSIGSELCRQLPMGDPRSILMLDTDESRLYELYLEMESRAPGITQMRICDVRDDRKVLELLNGCTPDVCIHAAAYKHVPLMEIEPDEAVKTNVMGTRNVIDACVESGVRRFVLISTDKAVEPKSVMGVTKAVAERMVLGSCQSGLQACVVRFGNVLGSRGSVVPIFEEQLRRGESLKVTHPEVTRYFMTIPEATRLVLYAQAMSEGGDVFVLDMGTPVRIVDLARKMIALSGSKSKVEFVGLRPAEKLHEELVGGTEELLPTESPNIMCTGSIPLPNNGMPEALRAVGLAARLNDRPMLRATLWRLLADIPHIDPQGLQFLEDEYGADGMDVVDPDMETLL